MVKTTVKVEGMMCPNCERHLNEGIQANFQVESVESSHKKKRTEIVSSQPLDEAKLNQVIIDAGYKPGKITVK